MTAENSRNKMRSYRERLRLQGLRPVQIWVPDCRSPRFHDSIRRQIAYLDPSDEKETLEFIEKVSYVSSRQNRLYCQMSPRNR